VETPHRAYARYVPLSPVEETVGFRFAKRLADIVVASFAIFLLSPLLLVTALLVWAEDRGPVLYRQARVGRFGKQFWFYKFRSMRVDADRIREQLLKQSDAQGAAFKMKNDPRITRIGRFIRKFSIDEMPQLFAVLAGHMAIIGPRPHLAIEVSTYTPEQYVRLAVKPGLLCLREIKGRSNLSFEQWLDLDLEYVKKRTWLLDMKIMSLAIPAVIKGDGAY
jgi:lipopolysaccharide/colanic/teichoic acid biosynthesis glycosyltransferase